MSEDVNDNENTIKRFFTKGGTTVEFNEEQGEEKITLSTNDKLSFTMQEKGGNILIDVNGAFITLDRNEGKILIEANNGIVLKTGKSSYQMKPDGGIDIEGGKICMKGESIHLKSESQLSLNGIKSELKGDAETNISTSGVLKINGAMIKIN
ncbi:MAG: hypothetical protein VB095_08765 [Anaerovorax sp.]|nr:hypothetical protein [Anaerovorax sp.]